MGAEEGSASRLHPGVILRVLHSPQYAEAQETHLKNFAKYFYPTYVFSPFEGFSTNGGDVFLRKRDFFFEVEYYYKVY